MYITWLCLIASESVVQSAESQKEDKSVAMMKSVISSMVSTLKVKINTTEKVLGDKLKVLDQDGDGEISLNEIKDVVATVLKKGSSSEEQVSQMFQVLDSNKDGKGTLAHKHNNMHSSCMFSSCLCLSS